MLVIVSFAIFWASRFVVASDLLDSFAALDQKFPSCDKVGTVLLAVRHPKLPSSKKIA